MAGHYLYQDISIPTDVPSVSLNYLWAMNPLTIDTTLSSRDALTVTVRTTENTVLQTLAVYGDSSERRLWSGDAFDLSAYIGQNIRYYAQATTENTTTSWYLSKIYLYTCTLTETLYLPVLMRAG